MADTERFENLFRRSWLPVVRFVHRRARPGVDAEDVAAEVFRLAWAKLASAPADAELVWLYGLARGVLSNHQRGERRRTELRRRLTAQPRPSGSAVDTGPGRDDPTWLLAAVRDLPAAEREAVELLAWEELTMAEIAVVLDCSPAAVRVRLHRARRRLRDRVPARRRPPSVTERIAHRPTSTPDLEVPGNA